jgi:hypothetical protein
MHVPTIQQFRTLAQAREWTEDWLVEQCRHEMDNPRQSIREILASCGLTKPWFTGETTKPKLVSMLDTALVWTPLLRLYATFVGRCVECETSLEDGQVKFCSPRCRKRSSRRSVSPQNEAIVPA